MCALRAHYAALRLYCVCLPCVVRLNEVAATSSLSFDRLVSRFYVRVTCCASIDTHDGSIRMILCGMLNLGDYSTRRKGAQIIVSTQARRGPGGLVALWGIFKALRSQNMAGLH